MSTQIEAVNISKDGEDSFHRLFPEEIKKLHESHPNISVVEREQELTRLRKILKDTLYQIPCSYVPNHTEENLPELVKQLAQEYSAEYKENETLTKQKDLLITAILKARELVKYHEPKIIIMEEIDETLKKVKELDTAETPDVVDAAKQLVSQIEELKSELDKARKALMQHKGTTLPSEVEKWQRAHRTVSEERAASFAMLSKTVGGVGMTEYQPEVDILIDLKIKSIKDQRDLYATKLQEIYSKASSYLYHYTPGESKSTEKLAAILIDIRDTANKTIPVD
jgi:DNA repair exonuclease SbcCD ATPase subunit